MSMPTKSNPYWDKAAWAVKQLDAEHFSALTNMLSAAERSYLAEALKSAADLSADAKSALVAELSAAAAEGPVLAPNASAAITGLVAAEDMHKLLENGSDEEIWTQLNQLESSVLAAYLSKETAAIAAFALSRLSPKSAAAVLRSMPAERAAEILQQLSRSTPVSPSVEDNIAATLQRDLLQNRPVAASQLIDIFAALDLDAGEKLLEQLAELSPETAAEIRRHRLSFEDLLQLSDADMKQFAAQIDKEDLAAACRAVSEALKERFFAALPEVSAKVLRESMQKSGPIKISEVEAAQNRILSKAMLWADQGRIAPLKPLREV